MRAARRRPDVVEDWVAIPGRIHEAIGGLRDVELSVRGGSEGWSIAEYVHHLVEANLIASHIILAALGKPGWTYDWSWVTPDRGWMVRLSYDRAPVEPAVQLLEALTRHVSNLLRLSSGSLRRPVALLDAPGAAPRRSTVAKLLRDEVVHATHHLADVASARGTGRILHARFVPPG